MSFISTNYGMRIKRSGRSGSMDTQLERNAKDIINALDNSNQRFSDKKILLTGAAGFLGCQFVHYFKVLNDSGILSAPCHLYAWDNYLRGVPDWLTELDGSSGINMEKRDIIYDIDYPKPDFIIHAASIASPIYYRKYPIETIDSNVTGLRNILEYSKVNNIESLLFFSTSEIYGDPDPAHIPTTENYRGYVSCTGPRACYDESKRLGETLCVNFWQIHNVPVKIVRPFNNYGPGLKITDKRVVPDFFRDIINNRDIVILSDGKASRTFCYISDAIEGYLRLLLSDYNGEPFNIGSDSPEVSIGELAETIIDISGKKLEVQYQASHDSDYLVDNPKRRCPSIDKAKKFLGYNPKINLEEGLRRTYDYYIGHPDAEEL
jgi:UDP-glucuronate decarboxylase